MAEKQKKQDRLEMRMRLDKESHVILIQICAILFVAVAAWLLIDRRLASDSILGISSQLVLQFISITFALFLSTAIYRVTWGKRIRALGDVFVSFSYTDRDFVRGLVEDLRTHGVRVVDPDEAIRVGDNISARVTELVQACSHAILVIGADYDRSDWARFERESLFGTIKLVPIVLPGAEILPSLEEIRYLRAGSAESLSAAEIEQLVKGLPQHRLGDTVHRIHNH